MKILTDFKRFLTLLYYFSQLFDSLSLTFLFEIIPKNYAQNYFIVCHLNKKPTMLNIFLTFLQPVKNRELRSQSDYAFGARSSGHQDMGTRSASCVEEPTDFSEITVCMSQVIAYYN